MKKLKQRFSDHIIEIIRLMLKFEENERPSFIELSKLVLTSTENTIESPKPGAPAKPGVKPSSKVQADRKVSKTFSMNNLKEQPGDLGTDSEVQKSSHVGRKVIDQNSSHPSHLQEETAQNLMT